MTLDPRVRTHQEWLGMVQPTGLFLAPSVLAEAGAAPTEPVVEVQAALAEHVADGALRDPVGALREVFGWPDAALLHGDALPPDLALSLDGGVRVEADFALRDLDEPGNVLLGMVVAPDVSLDAASEDPAWTASAHQRFERLLRARECPVGVLTNHRAVRILYAPKGEATAHATWKVSDLLAVAGRPMLAALHMCLNARRLLTLADDQRLPKLLAKSREFQNSVSNRLQGQVLDALQELLDGLQRADRVTDGRLLAPWRGGDDDRQVIYRGLVTALMRMVFVLFAEERRLLPLDARRYRESYALTDLHARLQADYDRLGDRLDARYGAWAQVVALFRLLHDGLDAKALPEGFVIPPRRGEFFDPDRFPFLEGRAPGPRAPGPLELPKISDGSVRRVLDKLLVLKGERLKYSDLAVEQIGSVYEGIMGYTLELAEGRALRVRVARADRSGILDLVVDLQRFADLARKDFLKHLTDDLGLKLSDGTAKAITKATTEAEVAAALTQQRSFERTTAIERGWMFLQPGEERRRSGSHYTPRSLTQPIVERTLAPVLAALGEHPTPEAILALRVCDPAMGSGAFLVEACRQLASRLEAAWQHHDAMPAIPPDEDPHLHARRRVAQRCLYGVDRNPLAVELARLSLWLETFARDHAFTFVDHCLRHGDSLVGLSLEQIASVSLATGKGAQLDLVRKVVNDTLVRVRGLRREIHAAGDGDPPDNDGQRSLWREAQEALVEARTVGDLVVAGFFSQKSDKDRAKWIAGQHVAIGRWLAKTDDGAGLRSEVRRVLGARGVVPFHWELEFPEVFEGERRGFDAFVGNPPFLGGTMISTHNGASYLQWLTTTFDETGKPPTSSRLTSSAAPSTCCDAAGPSVSSPPTPSPRETPDMLAPLDLHARRHDLRGAPALRLAGPRGGRGERRPHHPRRGKGSGI
ncbi:MAG: N-6 DNA methylase [Deltaproteobacteria bacterium]|nr:N-6 DNA methylase [Deltaproteobacteria bacterium]